MVHLSGAVTIEDFNERFDLALPEELYETIGGYVFGSLGRVADPGDEVTIPGGVLRVVKMDGRRIERLAFIAEIEKFDHGSE